MKFKEIPQAVERFVEEQLQARERRLLDPGLQRQLENMKLNMKDDLHSAVKRGGEASARITLAPLIGLYEGFVGSPLKTFVHNSSIRNPEHKKEYPNVLATAVSETLAQYAKGGLNALQMCGHLAKLAGRASILLGRYTIGK